MLSSKADRNTDINKELNTDRPSYSTEQAFEKVKGCRFYNVLVIMTMSLVFSSGSFIVFNIGFLTKGQEYLCKDLSTGVMKHCSVNTFCRTKPENTAVDTNVVGYIYNWY